MSQTASCEKLLVDDGKRVLSRQPSEEIAQIVLLEPGIYSYRRGGICASSPINFIGSLLTVPPRWLLSGRDPFKFNDAGIELFHNVPLSVYQDDSHDYQPIGLTAEDVLFKRACGAYLGVVLTGNMAGLFLRPQNGVQPNEGMCVNRVWNDEQLAYYNRPYDPRNHTPNRGYAFWESMLQKVVDPLYKAEVKKLQQELNRTPYSTELFFKLCQRFNLPLNEAGFHYTRWIEPSV